MSYTPTTWSSGDLITSAKLNKIEQGLAAASDLDTTLAVSGKPADSKAVGDEVAELKNDLTEAQNDIEAAQGEIETLRDTAYIVNTAEGNIAAFSDGAAADVKALTVNIEPIQSGSGDPSLDNVRPISGRTGATVWRTGKNLLPNTPGVSAGNNYQYYKNDGITLKPGTYTIKIFSDVAPTFLYIKPIGSISEAIAQINGGEMSFTVSDTVTVWIDAYWSGGTGKPATAPNIQLEPGTTATDYTPCTGTTIPVSWQTEAGTVYGGELDMVSGVLTVDRAKHIVTSSDTVGLFQQEVNASRIAVAVPDSKLSPNNVARTDLICSISKPSATIPLSSSMFEVGYCCMYSAGSDTYSRFIICIPSNIGSANDARDWLVENNCEFVYELATPQTYQLTPQQVQTLLGENVIYSDAGSVSVDYRADTKLFIEQLTKPTEDDMTANTAIQSGKFFMIGNRLFISTAAIASGDTIKPGTNCTELSLADALNNLN